MATTNGDSQSFVIKLRGLPFSTNKNDVLHFLSDVQVVGETEGVHLTEVRPGRPSGECFVEVSSQDDMDKSFKKDKQHMGSRYIEVFKSDKQEMQWATTHTRVSNGNTVIPSSGGVVKLRGLPFGCSKDEIIEFFSGLPVNADAVTILSDHTGRSSGEAFVHFPDKESAEKALEKDREEIGHRYIEVFRSSPQEVRSALDMLHGGPGGRPVGRPGPYDRFGDRYGGGRFPDRRMRPPPNRGGYGGGNYNDNYWPRGGPWKGSGAGTGHCVHMRGLPYKATLQDIAYFFRPIHPLNINIIYDNNNRPSGEADVEFECHEDAVRAMMKDRNSMDNRYIELFLNSSQGGRGGGGGGGGGYGGRSYRN